MKKWNEKVSSIQSDAANGVFSLVKVHRSHRWLHWLRLNTERCFHIAIYSTICSDLVFLLKLSISFLCLLLPNYKVSIRITAAARLDWIICNFWLRMVIKPAIITDKNNRAAVYVGRSLTVYTPLLHKLWLHKVMRCFYWSVRSK